MKLFWKSYGILFFFVSLGQALYFFSLESNIRLYYDTLTAFDNSYKLHLFFNMMSTILTLIASIIVICYSFNFFKAIRTVQYILYLRLIADILGHHYEWKFIESAFAQGNYPGFLTLAALILPLIPSYIAHWRYAFNKST